MLQWLNEACIPRLYFIISSTGGLLLHRSSLVFCIAPTHNLISWFNFIYHGMKWELKFKVPCSDEILECQNHDSKASSMKLQEQRQDQYMFTQLILFQNSYWDRNTNIQSSICSRALDTSYITPICHHKGKKETTHSQLYTA